MNIFNSISNFFINLYRPRIETPLTSEDLYEMLANDIHRISVSHCAHIAKATKNDQRIGFVGVELMFFYIHMLDIYLLNKFNSDDRNKIFNKLSYKITINLANLLRDTDISIEAKGAIMATIFNTSKERQCLYSKCKELCIGDFLSGQGSKLFVLNYYIHKEMMIETNINNVDEDLFTGKRPMDPSDIKYLPQLRDATNIYAISNIKAMNEKWNLLFKNSEIGFGKN